MLALPHNDLFDGRHFCGARSYVVATTGHAWRAEPVSTCAPGASSSRRVWTASLWRRLVNRRFDLNGTSFFVQ